METKKTFSYIEAIKFGFNTLIQNFWLILRMLLLGVGIIFIPMLLAGLVLGLSHSLFLESAPGAIGPIILGIIGTVFVLFELFLIGWFNAGFTAICLKLYDKQPVNSVLEVFDVPKKTVIQYILCNFLFIIAVALGLLFFIVPGIVFYLRYFFAHFIVIDKNLDAKPSFSYSRKIAYGAKWKLLGFEFLIMLAFSLLHIKSNVLGSILGAISQPFIILAHTYIYRKLQEQDEDIPVND